MLEILNLGAGVQSTTIALLSVHGELPKLDHAYFADTMWEPQRVYDHFAWLRPILQDAGIQVHVVNNGDIRADGIRSKMRNYVKEEGERWAALPYFVKNENGTRGMTRRQCTSEYKIQPIEKAIKTDLLGLQPRKRWPTEVVARRWFGISIDEMQRMRSSGVRWCTNYYPLIEMRKDRSWCLKWMHNHGYPEPPRSACIGCPFHSDREWSAMKRERPEEFEDACQFDEAIRHCDDMRGEVYLHRTLQPLREVVFDDYRIALWDDECSGTCGV